MNPKNVTLKEIEDLRHQLAKIVYAKGYTSIETIAVSQKLDNLLNVYNNLKCGKR